MSNKSLRIAIVGSPCSGKSTLASQVNSVLKLKGLNSIFLEEYAVEYIAKFGIPNSLSAQMLIMEEQLKKEELYLSKKDYIVCDSASFTSYLYARLGHEVNSFERDKPIINWLHSRALDSTYSWDFIFYVPPLKEHTTDAIRYHDKEQSEKIDRMIRGWLEIEQVPFIDLSSLPLDNRVEYVINLLIHNNKNEVEVDV